MNQRIFSVALITAMAIAAVAHARQADWQLKYRETAAEAQADTLPSDPECLDASGVNICTRALGLFDQPEGLRWAAVWVKPGYRTQCVHPSDVDAVVRCDLPGAVTVVAPPEPPIRIQPRPAPVPRP